MPTHATIGVAIGDYEGAVDEVIAELRRPLLLDIVTIILAPVLLSVIPLVLGSIAGFLSTLGLGGINAAERFRRGQTILKSYWSECSKLKKSVRRLRHEWLLCDPSDDAGLTKVEHLLRDYMNELDEGS